MSDNPTTKRRTIMQYHFEGGGSVYVDVIGDVRTINVIWALRELMRLKMHEVSAEEVANNAAADPLPDL